MKCETAEGGETLNLIMYRTVKWATEGKTILRFDWYFLLLYYYWRFDNLHVTPVEPLRIVKSI